MEQVTIVFEPAEEGGYSAYIAEVPGVNSQGQTVEEAREMVIEALHEMFEYRREMAQKRAAKGSFSELVSLAG